MPIEYVTGDATRPQGSGPKVICHCCNDMGKWGSGFVLALNARWPGIERLYREWHRNGASPEVHSIDGTTGGRTVEFELGRAQLVQVETDVWVANIIGQHRTINDGERTPIRYSALTSGLAQVALFCKSITATAHMPRLGAGLARGKWERIEPIIDVTLVDRGVAVTVYDLKAPT